MTFYVGVVGEAWELIFVEKTIRALLDWLPTDIQWLIPSEYAQVAEAILLEDFITVEPCAPGFQDYRRVKKRLLNYCNDGDLLLVAAGCIPLDPFPSTGLGQAFQQDRICYWQPLSNDGRLNPPKFETSPHKPPLKPQHCSRKVGNMVIWSVDGSDNYFESLLANSININKVTVWKQYGSGLPVFTYNTNEFPELEIPHYQDYFILGSGILGISMILNAKPSMDTRVVVYDINPDQLQWIRYLLNEAAYCACLQTLVSNFRQAFPNIKLREVEAHEQDNARRQQEWYAQHHRAIAVLGKTAKFNFIVCNLLSDPKPLFSLLQAKRSTFFMYLDLFLVWRLDFSPPWVEHHVQMAQGLRNSLSSRMQSEIGFLPKNDLNSFQIQKNSPFIDS